MLPPNYAVPAALQHIVRCSVEKRDAREDITYPVIMEFLLVHKNPSHRFTLYSQINFRWNPDRVRDYRMEIPDIGLVNFRCNRPFIYRLGIESKRMISMMADLPPTSIVEDNDDVRLALHTAYYQAEDQAKAAIRGDHAPRQRPIDYFLLIGPYWTHVTVGPFSEAQLTVRTHKPSDSGDFWETVMAAQRLKAEPQRRELFLLGTVESAIKMEEVIASTDTYAAQAMHEAMTYAAMGAQ
jgi:hypothetical protein